MDRDRNVIIQVGEQEVGLRVNNWVLKETQKKAGCKGVVQLFSKIGMDDSNIDLETFIILLMESINEYNHHKKIDERLDERQTSELIDDMGGVIQALAKISEGLQTYVPKNSQPPQMVGEEI